MKFTITLSEEIDRLHAEHRRYAQRLEELIQKPYLSDEEQLEEVRLKKLKLHAKDLIYALERRFAVDGVSRNSDLTPGRGNRPGAERSGNAKDGMCAARARCVGSGRPGEWSTTQQMQRAHCRATACIANRIIVRDNGS